MSIISTETVATEAFVMWLSQLDSNARKAVARRVGLLQAKGVLLDHPYSSRIKGSRLRELRIQSGGRPLRVFYAFDVKRRAVLLTGGNKTGNDRFYAVAVPEAERLWTKYLESEAHIVGPNPGKSRS